MVNGGGTKHALDERVATRSLVRGLLRTARPTQWLKNVLVAAAPAAAGVLTESIHFGQTSIAFAAFCFAASGAYFINDASDIDADQRHPTKRTRPVAAGIVGVGTARLMGIALAMGGIGVAFAARWQLAVVVAGYVVLTATYSLWLKRIAVVDIVTVAAGFVIRAVAGAVTTGVPISDWFLIVASFGSLFVVTGKRTAESRAPRVHVTEVSATLPHYTDSYLAFLRTVSAGIVLVAYSLFAVEKAAFSASNVPWYELSILPFALGILRYALLVDRGEGAAPEDLLLKDRALQVIGVSWIAIFLLGVQAT